MPKASKSCSRRRARPCPKSSASRSTCPTLPSCGAAGASSVPGSSTSPRSRSPRTPNCHTIRASSRIRGRGAGRSWRRSSRRRRQRSSRQRSIRASARGRRIGSPTSCSPRCAMSSAAMSNQRKGADVPAQAPPQPCTIVIFGAAGDLTKRLLAPALYNLRRAGLLPDGFALIGVARADKDDAAFRRELGASLHEFVPGTVAADDWQWLAGRMHYVCGEFADPATYKALAGRLAEVAEKHHAGGNCLFYLATPPQAFASIVHRLGEAGLVAETKDRWRRVIIEKPFGRDLPTARALNRDLLGVLAETQIYRIDHYLGKETVQNIMVFRFANGLFEPLWNRDHIDHVQITVAETVTVERRGSFSDATGALRDLVPNHLFQLLTLTAMEPPSCFDAEALRSEKAKVLDAIHHFGAGDLANVVRGQYAAGTVGGRSVEPYRGAPNVAPNSVTETYVAMKLLVDNWRWAGVP